MRKADNRGAEAIGEGLMTTALMISLIFGAVDNGLGDRPKERHAKLYPSEMVTIGILFAVKGGRFRAFYRWLKCDGGGLLGGLPERTALQRPLRRPAQRAAQL